jgi:hypothetical protein
MVVSFIRQVQNNPQKRGCQYPLAFIFRPCLNSAMNKFNQRLAAEARQRRERILKLRGRGLTYAQIGKLLDGITRQRVEQIIKRGKQ